MDIQILLALQNFREATGQCLNSFFAFMTTIAVDYWVIVPALIMFWIVDKRNGLIMLFSSAIGRYVNALLKAAFCVYRPWVRSDAIKPLPEVMSGATGYSFPSGHASSVGNFYGALIIIYRKYKGMCIFFGVMILLTMLSRIYVGVHTPQDVIVGAATGLFAAFAGEKILNWVDKNPDKDWVVLLATVLLMAAGLAYITFKPYPMDYVDGVLLVDPKKMTVDGYKDPGIGFGMILGWFIERRYINFSTEGTKQQKFLRSAVGAIAFVFIYTAVVGPIGKKIGIGIVHFILQAALMVLFMTVYPIIFTKFEKKFPPKEE